MNVLGIDWSKFGEYVSKLILYQSKNTRVPIRAESWEEILFTAFLKLDCEVEWNPTGHEKGVDLRVKPKGGLKELAISAKGGKLMPRKRQISLSSYRLTRYSSLSAKLKFLEENAKDLDFYLTCPREETQEALLYRVFKIPSKSLTPGVLLRSANWKEDTSAWHFTLGEEAGFEAKIVKKMSNQLWYQIPEGFSKLECLAEVAVKRNSLGKNLLTALK